MQYTAAALLCLLCLLPGAAWSQGITDTSPESPGGLPREGGQMVLEPLDGGRYKLTVVASDGQLYRCATATDREEPCTLVGLPLGKLTLRISGDAHYEQTLNLSRESVLLRVEGHNPWYGWLAVGGLGGGFLASVVAVGSLGVSEGFSGTTLVGFLASPILYTVGLIYGILWLVDEDKVSVERFDLSMALPSLGEHAVARAGLLPHGGVGLELRW